MPVPAPGGKDPDRGEQNRDAALHIKAPRTRHNSIPDRKGPLRRFSVREHRIEMPDETDKGFCHIPPLGNQQVPGFLILVETYRKTAFLQRMRGKRLQGIHGGFVF